MNGVDNEKENRILRLNLSSSIKWPHLSVLGLSFELLLEDLPASESSWVLAKNCRFSGPVLGLLSQLLMIEQGSFILHPSIAVIYSMPIWRAIRQGDCKT